MPALVTMHRSEPAHPGGPVFADVHPDECAAMAAAGWEFIDQNSHGGEGVDQAVPTAGKDAPIRSRRRS